MRQNLPLGTKIEREKNTYGLMHQYVTSWSIIDSLYVRLQTASTSVFIASAIFNISNQSIFAAATGVTNTIVANTVRKKNI